ncbi:MAG: TrkA family potassium uptake protein [Phycisphaerae bacterium]|nr:TrkA family potassium uptake protein [Phycisphaerae bacterium]
MRSARQRFRAHLYYLRKPVRHFLPLLLGLIVLLFLGSISFHFLFEKEELGREVGYVEALYLTYCLIFMEHLLEFPDHWLLRFFYFVLPPLGLVVILDGIVRFSYHFLRLDETSPEWVRAMCKTLDNHVVLCGLGKVGLRTLEQLLLLGEQVAVLEKDPLCPNLAYASKHGVPVRIGHSREEGVFDQLNIARAKSIILATDDDLANLEMALDARKLHPEIRVILRMFDQELASKVRESLGMELTFSTSELAAPVFATSSSDRSIVNSFYVDGRLLALARIRISQNSQLIGKQIRDLGRGQHAFVLSHSRGDESTLFPSAETTFQAGDALTVQTEPHLLKEIHRQNHDPEPY